MTNESTDRDGHRRHKLNPPSVFVPVFVQTTPKGRLITHFRRGLVQNSLTELEQTPTGHVLGKIGDKDTLLPHHVAQFYCIPPDPNCHRSSFSYYLIKPTLVRRSTRLHPRLIPLYSPSTKNKTFHHIRSPSVGNTRIIEKTIENSPTAKHPPRPSINEPRGDNFLRASLKTQLTDIMVQFSNAQLVSRSVPKKKCLEIVLPTARLGSLRKVHPQCFDSFSRSRIGFLLGSTFPQHFATDAKIARKLATSNLPGTRNFVERSPDKNRANFQKKVMKTLQSPKLKLSKLPDYYHEISLHLPNSFPDEKGKNFRIE